MDAGRIGLRHRRVEVGGRPLVLLPDLRGVGEDPLVERRLDVLPAPGLLAVDQSREHARRQEEAGRHARGGKVEVDGSGAPPGLLVLHAGAGLDRGVPAGSISEAVPGRIGRHRAEDQAGTVRCELRVGEPQPVHGAGAERLHQHIGIAAEAQEHLPALGRLEVEHHRPSAAVPDVVAGLVPKGISARRLDLDDVGTELGEEQDADGPRHPPAQIEHADAPQRSCRHRHVPAFAPFLRSTCPLLLRSCGRRQPPPSVASTVVPSSRFESSELCGSSPRSAYFAPRTSGGTTVVSHPGRAGKLRALEHQTLSSSAWNTAPGVRRPRPRGRRPLLPAPSRARLAVAQGGVRADAGEQGNLFVRGTMRR